MTEDTKETPERGSYVEKVRKDTRAYARELLVENERLRALLASVEGERQRFETDLASARRELARRMKEHGQLEEQMASVERENRQFSERFVDIERRNNDLASLYVASYRLHSTLDRDEVLTALQEILVNLVGSEELAIFELTPGARALQLLVSTGIDPDPFRSVALGEGRIGRSAIEGEIWIRSNGHVGSVASESELTACIPLKLEGAVRGAVAVFRLLQQKVGVEGLDREIFELLSVQAATALYCTGLHARVGAGAGA